MRAPSQQVDITESPLHDSDGPQLSQQPSSSLGDVEMCATIREDEGDATTSVPVQEDRDLRRPSAIVDVCGVYPPQPSDGEFEMPAQESEEAGRPSVIVDLGDVYSSSTFRDGEIAESCDTRPKTASV